MNLPNDQLAEQSIIGALMINEALIGQASLPPEDFYWPSTREAFRAILALRDEQIELSPPSIHYRTADTNHAVSVVELSNMLDAARGITVIHEQVEAVREKARKRRIAKVSAALQSGALAGECSLDLIHQGEAALAELRLALGDTTGAFRSLKEIDTESGVEYARLRRGESNAVPTGFNQLDYTARGGIQSGEVWVIAALTGRGKSSWALNAARYQAEQGYPVAFVSQEMSDYENYTRLVCGAASIPAWRVRAGMFQDTYDLLNEWRKPVSELPMYINSTTASVAELKILVKELVRARGIRSLFVDYLQLLESDAKNSSSRAMDVASTSRALKRIAMENKIGVFALAQFNRMASHGDRPELHHLAESGGIEKDASLVLILDMNEQKDGETLRPCTMRIAKHRNGPLMSLKYNYRGDTLTFEERP